MGTCVRRNKSRNIGRVACDIEGERMNRGERGEYSKSGPTVACNQHRETEYSEDGRELHRARESQNASICKCFAIRHLRPRFSPQALPPPVPQKPDQPVRKPSTRCGRSAL